MGGDDLTDSFTIEPVGFEDDENAEEYFLDEKDYPNKDSDPIKSQTFQSFGKKFARGKGSQQLTSVTKTKKKLKRRRITEDESVMNPQKRGKSSDFLEIYNQYLSKKQYSSLEKDEIQLKEKHFCNIPGSIDIASCLSDVLLWDPSKCSKESKKAHVVFVCSAAMRCVELINVLKKSQTIKSAFISKMFATHMKVEQQAKMLSKEAVHVCVGTPLRLSKLLDEGHLEMDRCCFVIIDFNWRNSKYKRIVDIPETNSELMTFLASIFACINSYVAKLVIY